MRVHDGSASKDQAIQKEVTHMRTIVRKTVQVLAVAAPLTFLVVETAPRTYF
jgi:hypothetical protein